MGKFRIFVAVEVAPSLWDVIESAQDKLKKQGLRDVKWVKAQNLHFTLKFLGDVEEEQIGGIAQKLSRALDGYPSFSLKFSDLGAFPSEKNPKVIWVGVAEGRNELIGLAQIVERGIGYPPNDKPFQPHLTIGRVKGRIADLPILAIPGGYWIKHVGLYSSELTKTGPIYTKLHEFSLES